MSAHAAITRPAPTLSAPAPSAEILADPRLSDLVAALDAWHAADVALTEAEDAVDAVTSQRAADVAREAAERSAHAAARAAGKPLKGSPFRAAPEADYLQALADADAVTALRHREAQTAARNADAALYAAADVVAEVARGLMFDAVGDARDALARAESHVLRVETLVSAIHSGAVASALAAITGGNRPPTPVERSRAASAVARTFTTDGARALATWQARGQRLHLGERLDLLAGTAYTVTAPRQAEPIIYGAQDSSEWDGVAL